MMVAAFPSYDLSFLAWFGLVPLFLAFARIKPLYGVFLSFIFGVVFYTGLFYWMFDLPGYMVLHHAVLGLYLCPLLGLFAWLFCFSAKRRGLTAALVSAPFVWIVLEYVRSNLSFLALPWGLLAHSQYQNHIVMQLTALTGVYGLSFFIVLVNSALTMIVVALLQKAQIFKPDPENQFYKPANIVLAAVTGFMTVFVLVHGYLVLKRPIEGKHIRIAAIQANIEQSKKWDPKYAPTIMQIYSDLTREASADDPQLIVWPEAATPKSVYRDRNVFNTVKNLAVQTDTPILLGSTQLAKYKIAEPRQRAQFLNSAFLIRPDANRNLTLRYNKIRLLPFSEYLPYKETIPWSYLHIPGADNYLPGKKYTVFDQPGYRFGVTICWENIFPDHVRKFVGNGAQFLINITNEAWFGETAAPDQFLSMNVFRAVENRRFLLRCANTGISCLIDPRGRIIKKLEDKSGKDIFVRGNLIGSVIPVTEKTFYSRYGDWPVWLSIIYFLCFLVFAIIAKKRNIA